MKSRSRIWNTACCKTRSTPHFIYNTLNGIRWMATLQHATGIAEMVTALSRLLKSVSKGNERLVPLYEEFALLNDYFTIQQYRYGGTITMDVSYIEDENLARQCRIPRFTLQPLVGECHLPRHRTQGLRRQHRADGGAGGRRGGDPPDRRRRGHDPPNRWPPPLREPGPEEAAAKFRHVGHVECPPAAAVYLRRGVRPVHPAAPPARAPPSRCGCPCRRHRTSPPAPEPEEGFRIPPRNVHFERKGSATHVTHKGFAGR